MAVIGNMRELPPRGPTACSRCASAPRVAEFIAAADQAVAELIPGVRSIAFGHIGDGNIHYNPLQPVDMGRQEFLDRWHEVNDLVHAIIDRLDGSISAEHGVGRLKRDEITKFKPEVEIDVMRAIKATLEPQGILNPGKVV